MSDHPYHVAGGFFAPTRNDQAAPVIPPIFPKTEAAGHAPRRTSRRRKLWELPHKYHCPVVGVCFGVDELRGLMARNLPFPRDTGDFVLHTTAVGACESRTQLAEALHKQLEKRFQLVIRTFATAKDAETLGSLWKNAVRSGSDLPGALWASWTHPACDAQLEQDIYADIHMIQHQLGTGTRADLATLKTLQADNIHLRRQLAAAQRENESLRAEKARETQRLGQRVAELRIDLASRETHLAELNAQLTQLRSSLPDLKDRQALARRASDAEARACALTAQAGKMGREIDNLRGRLHTQNAQASLAATKAPAGCSAATVHAQADGASASLSGKRVLCVGGRSGAIDSYRQVIEKRGGEFLHHDGGLEESLHRIDGVLAAADLVICQAGCISHNAYWRVKEQCKRTGKPCIYMKIGGASGLSRLIDQARPEQSADVVRY